MRVVLAADHHITSTTKKIDQENAGSHMGPYAMAPYAYLVYCQGSHSAPDTPTNGDTNLPISCILHVVMAGSDTCCTWQMQLTAVLHWQQLPHAACAPATTCTQIATALQEDACIARCVTPKQEQ